MPLIRINDEAPREYDILPKGMYEVYVEAYDEPELNDFGQEKSSFTLVIRDDLEQEHAKRKIWVNISTNPNIAWKLSTIARAAGVPSGTDFDSLADYLAAIKGASMKVKVDHRVWNEKTYVDVKAFYPTEETPYVVEETTLDNDILI